MHFVTDFLFCFVIFSNYDVLRHLHFVLWTLNDKTFCDNFVVSIHVSVIEVCILVFLLLTWLLQVALHSVDFMNYTYIEGPPLFSVDDKSVPSSIRVRQCRWITKSTVRRTVRRHTYVRKNKLIIVTINYEPLRFALCTCNERRILCGEDKKTRQYIISTRTPPVYSIYSYYICK